MVKYLQIYQDMISQNQEVFDRFGVLHNQYALEPKKYKDEFNRVGEEVLTLVRRYEARLCSHSENSGFGKFSGGLAGKFWEKLTSEFPLIEEVGIR